MDQSIPGKVDFYLDLLTISLTKANFIFELLIVPDKAKLHHSDFNQDS